MEKAFLLFLFVFVNRLEDWLKVGWKSVEGRLEVGLRPAGGRLEIDIFGNEDAEHIGI